MPQYVVIAWDGTDEQAPARRAAVRDAHLDNVAPMFADGRMKEGGAILNDQGQMIGSTCIVEFDTVELLQEWLQTDPYIVGNVWQKIEVHPFRCAPRRLSS